MRPLLIFLLIGSSFSLSAQEEKIYQQVEQMPEYPGGEENLMKFIQTNLRYPDYEKQNRIEGRVIIGFRVSETGEVINAHVMKSLSPGMDKEALRLVNSLERFKPGKQNGKAMAVTMVIPVKFTLPLLAPKPD